MPPPEAPVGEPREGREHQAQHEPAHGSIEQRIRRLTPGQGLYGQRGGFDAGVDGFEQQGIALRRPPCQLAASLRFADQRLRPEDGEVVAAPEMGLRQLHLARAGALVDDRDAPLAAPEGRQRLEGLEVIGEVAVAGVRIPMPGAGLGVAVARPLPPP